MPELRRIVHVDDDADILEITRIALQTVDSFELHQFGHAEAALAELKSLAPDLLLLDVMMPGMTGPELWEEVRRRPDLGALPAVFMTAKAEEQLSSELRARGALDVVTKPFDPMTLGQQLRAAWARA